MKETFKLHGLRPLSVNSTYARTIGGVVKSSEARDWYYTAFHLLSSQENSERFAKLRAHFDPKKHIFKVHIRAYYPKAQFVTKQGAISSKTLDLTNTEKSIIDCLFLKRFYDQPTPQGCLNLNTDDKYILDLHSCKRIAQDDIHRIEVDVEILDWNVQDYVG